MSVMFPHPARQLKIAIQCSMMTYIFRFCQRLWIQIVDLLGRWISGLVLLCADGLFNKNEIAIIQEYGMTFTVFLINMIYLHCIHLLKNLDGSLLECPIIECCFYPSVDCWILPGFHPNIGNMICVINIAYKATMKYLLLKILHGWVLPMTNCWIHSTIFIVEQNKHSF